MYKLSHLGRVGIMCDSGSSTRGFSMISIDQPDEI